MAHRALSEILLGADPPAKAGDTLPATYRDLTGSQQPVDAERLVQLGVAEEIGDGPPALDALTRPDLDAHAEAHGVEEPAKLPNKQAVIDAIATVGQE